MVAPTANFAAIIRAASPQINAPATREAKLEQAMKLTSTRIAHAANQLDSWVVPETHPANLSLCEVFGDHTFFLDGEGLSIVEPSESETETAVELARIVKLATWADDERTLLAPHPREETGLMIVLDEAA